MAGKFKKENLSQVPTAPQSGNSPNLSSSCSNSLTTEQDKESYSQCHFTFKKNTTHGFCISKFSFT